MAIPHHPKGSKKDKLLMGDKCTFILLSGKLIKEIGQGLQHVDLNVLTRKEQQTKEKGGKPQTFSSLLWPCISMCHNIRMCYCCIFEFCAYSNFQFNIKFIKGNEELEVETFKTT
jgi:hypothetical protein